MHRSRRLKDFSSPSRLSQLRHHVPMRTAELLANAALPCSRERQPLPAAPFGCFLSPLSSPSLPSPLHLCWAVPALCVPAVCQSRVVVFVTALLALQRLLALSLPALLRRLSALCQAFPVPPRATPSLPRARLSRTGTPMDVAALPVSSPAQSLQSATACPEWFVGAVVLVLSWLRLRAVVSGGFLRGLPRGFSLRSVVLQLPPPPLLFRPPQATAASQALLGLLVRALTGSESSLLDASIGLLSLFVPGRCRALRHACIATALTLRFLLG